MIFEKPLSTSDPMCSSGAEQQLSALALSTVVIVVVAPAAVLAVSAAVAVVVVVLVEVAIAAPVAGISEVVEVFVLE